MARYTGADCRLCRREGEIVFERRQMFSAKCSILNASMRRGARTRKNHSLQRAASRKAKTKRIYGLPKAIP